MTTGELNATPGAPAGAGTTDVPVDWDTLEDAFENNAREVQSYLNLASGEVLRLVDGISDPPLRMRVSRDRRFLRIEPVSSREQYRWMERFIAMLPAGELQDKLAESIDGRGAFRRFKDALMAHAPEREQWFVFRGQRLAVFMEAWLKANTIRAVPRKGPVAASPPPDDSAPDAGRPPKTAESYRRQLRDLLATLSAKDLDKVLTFAEFVKARRIVRGATRPRAEPAAPRLAANELSANELGAGERAARGDAVLGPPGDERVATERESPSGDFPKASGGDSGE